MCFAVSACIYSGFAVRRNSMMALSLRLHLSPLPPGLIRIRIPGYSGRIVAFLTEIYKACRWWNICRLSFSLSRFLSESTSLLGMHVRAVVGAAISECSRARVALGPMLSQRQSTTTHPLNSALTKPNEGHDKPGKPGKRPGKFAKKESNSRQILLFYICICLPGFGNI